MRADRARAGIAGRATAPWGLMRLRRWARRGGGVLALPVVLALLFFQTWGGCTCPDVAAHGMPTGAQAAMAAGMAHAVAGAAGKDHPSHHVGPACSCCGAGLCGGIGLLPHAPALAGLPLFSPGVSLVRTADRPTILHDGHLRPPARAPPFSS